MLITMLGAPCDEQLAVLHVRVDSQDARGDHRVGEVEGDPAHLRAKLDTCRHQPAPLLYLLAGVLPDHEYFFGCGCVRQVGGEPGQLAKRPG